MSDLETLVSDPEFKTLSPGQQSLAIKAIAPKASTEQIQELIDALSPKTQFTNIAQLEGTPQEQTTLQPQLQWSLPSDLSGIRRQASPKYFNLDVTGQDVSNFMENKVNKHLMFPFDVAGGFAEAG